MKNCNAQRRTLFKSSKPKAPTNAATMNTHFQPAERLSNCTCNDENTKSGNQPEHLLENSFRWFHFRSFGSDPIQYRLNVSFGQ